MRTPTPNSLKVSRIRPANCALFTATSSLALLLLVGSPAQAATNVLGNAGFETGDATSWNPYGNALVESTNAHYYNGGNPVGASNVLTHSGAYAAKTYGNFSGNPNTDGFFQDFPASAGSVWSAGGFALSHEQDYIGFNNNFWFEVSFLDATNGLLARYKSYVFSPPTDGVISNLWYSLPVTNQIDISDPSFATVTNTVSNFTAPAGTARVRYQSVYYQPAFDGGSVYYDDLNLTRITDSNPDIYGNPTGTNIITTGKTVKFSVAAVGSGTLKFQWLHDGVACTNLTGKFVGALQASFFVINVAASDAGNYSCVVSNTAGTITSLSALMTVNLDPISAANQLPNPGFELGINGYIGFNGFAVVSTNAVYNGTTTPIVTHGGTNCLQVYNSGYSGVYHDVAVTPGSVWKAACWMLATTNQLDSWAGVGAGAVWMEVGLHAVAGDGVFTALYKSPAITATNFVAQRDTYVYLPVNIQYTNANPYQDVLATNTLIVIPPGSTSLRAQITRNDQEPGTAWVDDMTLYQLTPVSLTASNTGNSIKLSFNSSAGFNHQVYSTTNINGGTWQLLSNFTGDTSVKSMSDTLSGKQKFYRVQSN